MSADLVIPLGKNKDGELINWEPLKEKNPHLVIVGESGAGKSQTVKALISEQKQRGVAHVILDYGGEYGELADMVLDFGEGVTINPLEVVEQDAKSNSYLIPEILRKHGLVGGDQQEAWLRKAIQRAYGFDAERGIEPLIGPRTKPPTFSEVERSLRYFQSSDPQARSQINALMNRLGILLDMKIFSRETTVPFSEIVDKTTVISLKSLPGARSKLAVADFFLRRLWNFISKWGESRKLRLFCVTDEAHKLSYPDSPVDSILREARKYGVGMILASQRPHDFALPVFANTATKICFRCGLEADANFMAKQIGCYPGQIMNLSKDYEALVRIGSTETYERVQLTPYFKRESKETPSKAEVPPRLSLRKPIETQETSTFGGQVLFDREGKLTGDTSLKKWTSKDDKTTTRKE